MTKHIRLTFERRIKVFIGLILLTSFAALGQEVDFAVGFKIISTFDSSRTYKPNSPVADKLHFRPIDIDLWYPAEINSADTILSFANLVYLLEQRSNVYDDTWNYDGLTDELLQYICVGINCPDYHALKNIKTESYVNANPVALEFPLIIYLAGFNGMSYENYLLFESLVKKGFVVASVSSIGRYPGNMTMAAEDLFEQIKDANFTIKKLTKENLNFSEVGMVGYSWGGLAATVLAMEEPGKIKAIVSLDGSEQFTYADEGENEALNRIREADFFKPGAIKSSFLYLDSDITEWEDLPDSIYNITDFISGDKCYLKINHATHEDFSSLSVLSRMDGKSKYFVIQRLVTDYFRDRLKNEDTFYRNIPNEGITNYFSMPTVTRASTTSKERILKGIIRDKKSNLPLPYVNIGILNKDNGTTSGIKGEFELALSELDETDTLRISMIGYEPRVIFVKDLLKREKLNLNIQLQEKASELKEIVVVEKRLTTKVLGNKTASKFVGGKFASGDLGSEIAIRIKIKKAPTFLEGFSFSISYNNGDTATFRVNIYNSRSELPGESILTKNTLVKINGQTGRIDVDLSRDDITVNDDFFIGLEWVEGRNNSGIVFSSGFMNRGTYYRKASQGRWRKFPMGVGFNVTAKY